MVAAGEREGYHAHAVLIALEVAGAVEGLERVGRVVLEGAQESREAELLGVGRLVERLDEVEGVLVEHLFLVIPLLDEVLHLLFEVVEVDGVLVDVLEEVLARRGPVGVELDEAIGVVEVELGIQGVVVEIRVLVALLARVRQRACCQNFSKPSRTRATSKGVPSNSNLYMCGTWHLAATMSPAKP